MSEPIAMFTGTIARVQSMADGSPRFVIDAGEPALDLLSVLAKAQMSGVYLQFVVYDKEELEKDLKQSKT